jgi:hypothetical protein
MSIKLGFLMIETGLFIIVDVDGALLTVDGHLWWVLSTVSELFDHRLRERDLGGGGKESGANPSAGDEEVVIGLTIPSFWWRFTGPLERFLIAFDSELSGRALALLAAPEFRCKLWRGMMVAEGGFDDGEMGDVATRLPDLWERAFVIGRTGAVSTREVLVLLPLQSIMPELTGEVANGLVAAGLPSLISRPRELIPSPVANPALSRRISSAGGNICWTLYADGDTLLWLVVQDVDIPDTASPTGDVELAALLPGVSGVDIARPMVALSSSSAKALLSRPSCPLAVECPSSWSTMLASNAAVSLSTWEPMLAYFEKNLRFEWLSLSFSSLLLEDSLQEHRLLKCSLHEQDLFSLSLSLSGATCNGSVVDRWRFDATGENVCIAWVELWRVEYGDEAVSDLWGELERGMAKVEAEAEDEMPWLEEAADKVLMLECSRRRRECEALFLSILDESGVDAAEVEEVEVSLRVNEVMSSSNWWKCLWTTDGWKCGETGSGGSGADGGGPSSGKPPNENG